MAEKNPFAQMSMEIKRAIDHHNTVAATIALKEATDKFFYFETTLANGIKSFLNIILHENGNYYIYTISKNITVYE